MALSVASRLFEMSGVTSRALSLAFAVVRDDFGFAPAHELAEPRFGPEEGCASLSKADMKLHFLYYRPTRQLLVYYHGDISPEIRDAICRRLTVVPYPREL